MSIKDITIVITSFKSEKKIRKCLNSIDNQCYVINVENSDNNVLEATIKEIEFLGSFQRIYLEVSNVTEDLIMADILSSHARKINLALNDKLNICFPVEDIRVYPN